jgi:hypothetical protein
MQPTAEKKLRSMRKRVQELIAELEEWTPEWPTNKSDAEVDEVYDAVMHCAGFAIDALGEAKLALAQCINGPCCEKNDEDEK